MRIHFQLLSSESGMTAFLAAAGRRCREAAAPGTEIMVRGTPHGALGSEHRLFAHYDLRAVIEQGLDIGRNNGADAFVVANALDTGVAELREALDIPVLSHLETSSFWACTMGERFGIVSPHRKMVPRFRALIAGYGLASRLASVETMAVEELRSFNGAFFDAALGDRYVEEVLAAARRCIASGAEAIIPAGPHTTLLTARGIFAVDGAPILDCYALLVKAAEAAIAMHRLTGQCVSRTGLYEIPARDRFNEMAHARGIPL